MINKVFEVIRDDIQNYLIRLPELNITSQEVVSATPIINYEGNISIPNESLGLTLVNIEEERVVKSQGALSRESNGRISYINPEINLNLYILITANFNDYNTGLEYLSGAIRFFQSKNVFTHQNTPDLDLAIQKLIFELYTLSFEQQNFIWSSLGAKYIPSVMYKVRLITIQEAQKKEEQPPIAIVDSASKSI